MPNLRSHDQITVITGALLSPAFLAVPSDNRWLSWAVLAGAHLLSGLLFSCDLDVRAGEYRRWGPFRWIWWPYQRLIPHRSWISHGLIVGPLLRLGYFALVLELLLSLGAWALSVAGGDGLAWLNGWHVFWMELMRAYPRRFAEVAVGFILGGAAHSIPDWLLTGVRRVF